MNFKTDKYLPKKKFGQHFLSNNQYIDEMKRVIMPKQTDLFIEIGPGQGALTSVILPHCHQLDAIELDKDLIPILKKKFNHVQNFTLHHGDASQFPVNTLLNSDQKTRIIGNLPYNIATVLLFHFLKWKSSLHDLHIMIQKEVAQRICAQPGDKHYGRLSVILQYYCLVEYLIEIPPSAFSPPPQVDSAIVRLTPYTKLPFVCNNESLLQTVIKQAFQFKRKTLGNNFKKIIPAPALKEIGIDPQQRAEMLSVEQFVLLTHLINDWNINLNSSHPDS